MSIELVSISKRYRGTSSDIYRGLSVSFASGSSTAIVGPSGAGKSTLLNIIALALAPDSGEVRISGQSRTTREFGAISLAYIFQKDALLPWATVLENALLGVKCRGEDTPAAKRKALEYLDMFGLADCRSRYPATLSGGQRQLVAIVQNLLIEPEILLLDEPFAHLDFQTKLTLEAELLKAVNVARTRQECPTTVVLVTHDLEEAIVVADRILVVGRKAQRPVEIALDVTVPINPFDRDPVSVRESPVMRDLFHRSWSALKSFTVSGEVAVQI